MQSFPLARGGRYRLAVDTARAANRAALVDNLVAMGFRDVTLGPTSGALIAVDVQWPRDPVTIGAELPNATGTIVGVTPLRDRLSRFAPWALGLGAFAVLVALVRR